MSKEAELNNMINDVIFSGASYAKVFDIEKVKFLSKFREYCKENKCGSYGTNWMCPPAVGTIETLEKKVLGFKYGIIFQTIGKIKGKDDKEGMLRARDKHNNILRKIVELFKEKYKKENILPLGAGECKICIRCSYLDGQSCRHPEVSVSSAEAYGIDVGELLNSCELKYNYDDISIAYVGIILL